ncbi:MAG: cytochrome P450, partial [Phycisphaerales bacterium]|nr:cytochrome P450 [Phycisphaerales bacterium]
EDIVHMSKNPKIWSSARGGTDLKDHEEEDLDQIRLLMLNMDPPQHVKFRKLLSKGFTPRMISLLEPKIRARTTEIVDGICAKGSCDFVREVAAELPLIVIAELLGVPLEDRDQLFDWTNQLIGFDDPEFQTSMEDARMAAMEVWMYAQELADERMGQEGDDLVRVLMNAEVDGEKLSDMEFNAFFLLLVVAGNETTRNAIAGGLRTLIEHPDQAAILRANIDDDDLWTTATDEILRWVTPVTYFRRQATCDFEYKGIQFKEDDKFALMYRSANRDEAIFEDPYRFDVRRTPNHHLAFGTGEHFCMGASLARLEIRCIFQEIFRRLDNIELDGEIRRLRSNIINGTRTLPIKFDVIG